MLYPWALIWVRASPSVRLSICEEDQPKLKNRFVVLGGLERVMVAVHTVCFVVSCGLVRAAAFTKMSECGCIAPIHP